MFWAVIRASEVCTGFAFALGGFHCRVGCSSFGLGVGVFLGMLIVNRVLL